MGSILTNGTLAAIINSSLDSLASDFTLIKHSYSSFNPVTGVETVSTNTQTGVRGIICDYRLHDIGGSGGLIQLGDRRLILFVPSFSPDVNGDILFPEPDDTIKSDPSVVPCFTYKVINARQDPAQATWDLNIRRV